METMASCLWFDGQAEEAAKYYCAIFKRSKIHHITRYPDVGQETHGRQAGSVMTVSFELNGMQFLALNGGPLFKFNEASSVMVLCDTQEEVDYYWECLGAGGDPQARACGWLKDKFGLSWQVTPKSLLEVWNDTTPGRAERVMSAMMEMEKLDMKTLQAAYDGR